MNLLLESFHNYVRIVSDEEMIWKGFDRSVLFETFLPCVRCLSAQGLDNDDQVKLIHRFSSEQRIERSGNTTEIFDSWVGPPPAYVYVLIEQLIERARQERSIFSLHASSVSIDGHGVAILADNWHGKTSTAMYFALQGLAKVVANNRLILEDSHILGGSRCFDVKETFWQYFPDLEGELKGTAAKTHDGRYTFKWPQICYDDFPLSLVVIILSHINDGVREMKVIQPSDAIWYLFRQASFLIRGDCILFDGKVASPTYDDYELSQKRLAWIRQLTENIPLIYLAGSLEYIYEEVIGIVKDGISSTKKYIPWVS